MTKKQRGSLAGDAQRWLAVVAEVSDPTRKFSRPLFERVIYALLARNWSYVEVEPGEDFLVEKDWTAEKVEHWRADAHGILSGCVDGNLVLQEDTLRFTVMPQWDQPLLVVRGAFQDLLNFSLVALVKAAGMSRVRRCDCGRIWVKVGKLEACSARCQKRIYMRTFRKQNPGRHSKGRSHGKTTRKR